MYIVLADFFFFFLNYGFANFYFMFWNITYLRYAFVCKKGAKPTEPTKRTKVRKYFSQNKNRMVPQKQERISTTYRAINYFDMKI